MKEFFIFFGLSVGMILIVYRVMFGLQLAETREVLGVMSRAEQEGATEQAEANLNRFPAESETAEETRLPRYFLDQENYVQRVSPNGRMIAALGNDLLAVFDLAIKQEILKKTGAELNTQLKLDYAAEAGEDDLFYWQTDEQLMYPAYKETTGKYMSWPLAIKSIKINTE